MWRNWNPRALLTGMEMVQLPWKTGWRLLKQLKIERPYDPVLSFWVYSQQNGKRGLEEIVDTSVPSRTIHTGRKGAA